MKRAIAFVTVLVLCLTLLPAAYATDPNAPLKFQTTVKEYTWAAAKDAISYNGWEGVATKINELGLRLWVPSEVSRYTLKDEAIQSGYLAYFAKDDDTISIQVTRMEADVTTEEFLEQLQEHKMKNISQVDVNGIPFILYTDKTVKKMTCNVATMILEHEAIVEFVFYRKGDKTIDYHNIITASIRPIE